MPVEPSFLIEYHPPCTYYKDGGHRERSGYYLCECKASCAWHKTVPDTRLQAIADAWKKNKTHGAGANEWYQLKSLLDALTTKENQQTDGQ